MKIGTRVKVLDESNDSVYGLEGTVIRDIGACDTGVVREDGSGICRTLIEVQMDKTYFDEWDQKDTNIWLGDTWMVEEL